MHGTHDSYNVFPGLLWFSNIWDYFVSGSGSFWKENNLWNNTLFRSVSTLTSTITVQAGWLFLSFFCIFFFIINILPSRFDTSGVDTNGDVECTMIRVCIKPLRSSDYRTLTEITGNESDCPPSPASCPFEVCADLAISQKKRALYLTIDLGYCE